LTCGRVAALVGDGVAQAGQVHQRGLAEDVVAHHAGREPREVEVALALDQLLRAIGSVAGSQRRTRFSASTREVYGRVS
jgi:hypothetical protein